MKTTPENNTEKDQVQAQSQLVRAVEAALKVAIPDPEEIRFRGSLLRCVADRLPTTKQAFVIRLYEAACDVKFPSDDVTEFRKVLQKAIGRSLDLKAYRATRPA